MTDEISIHLFLKNIPMSNNRFNYRLYGTFATIIKTGKFRIPKKCVVKIIFFFVHEEMCTFYYFFVCIRNNLINTLRVREIKMLFQRDLNSKSTFGLLVFHPFIISATEVLMIK